MHTVDDIQCAIANLPWRERRELRAWIISRFDRDGFAMKHRSLRVRSHAAMRATEPAGDTAPR